MEKRIFYSDFVLDYFGLVTHHNMMYTNYIYLHNIIICCYHSNKKININAYLILIILNNYIYNYDGFHSPKYKKYDLQ